jgi:hypothetical protein
MAALLLAGAAHAATPVPYTFLPAFNPAAFTDPARIDNPYLPLTPCMRLVYEGAQAGHQKEKRVDVSMATTMVAGVRCRDVTVGVSIDGDPASLTDECYAQDEAGNVWLMGQSGIGVLCPLWAGDPCPTGLPPVARWKAGVAGAVPLLAMQAHPRVGQTYSQKDPLTRRASVIFVWSLTASLHVPYGPWVGDLLVTWETAALNRGVPEARYYAPGVGLLKSQTQGGIQETMMLVSVDTTCQVP